MSSIQNYQEYKSFLLRNKNPSKQKREKGKVYPYTHTGLDDIMGSFYIEDTDNLFELYERCRLDGMGLYLSEKPNEYGPLLIDIDFNFNESDSNRCYTLDDVKCLIERVNNTIEELYNMSDLDKLIAILFEKPAPSMKEKNDVITYKDGFHIMYPNIALSPAMRYYIIETVKESIRDDMCFEHIPFTNSLDDVFDMAVVSKNNWMLYGSKKDKSGQLYTITGVYNHEVYNDMKEEYLSRDINYSKELSIRKFTEADFLELESSGYQLMAEFEEKMSEVKSKYLKSKKSSTSRSRMMEDYVMSAVNNTEEYKLDDDESEEYIFNQMSNQDLTLVRKLIRILSPRRRENYQEWINVLWCCKNISPDLLSNLLLWSRKSSLYQSDDYIINLWDSARSDGRGYGIANLNNWAKEDSPEEYDRIMNARVLDIVRRAADDGGTHYSIALILYEKYRYDYKYIGGTKKGKGWYNFYNHRWHTLTNGSTLSLKLSNVVVDEFKKLRDYCHSQASKGNNNEEQAQSNIKNINGIMKKLKTTSFKNAVIDEASNMFLDDKFKESLDENRYLLGFENGVYDLENGVFRNGQPDDLLTFSTGYDYEEFDMDHPYVIEVENFFKKVQTQDDIRMYVLTFFATCLDGFNKRQRFHVFTGQKGSNGKSTCVEFLQLALGDYASTMPHTVITRKAQNASNATPELADKKGVRFISMNEPDKNDELHPGKLKELSGNDRILARALYTEPFYYKPQCKMIMPCNEIPYVMNSSGDGGFWRRFRVVPWDSRFLDHDEEIINPEKEFYKDYDIDYKLELWKPAFMWLLINKYYKIYKEQGLYEPPAVREYSDKYRRESDTFFEFLNYAYVFTKDKTNRIPYKTVYDEFKMWFSSTYTGRKVPPKKELSSYLDNNGYTYTRSYLYYVQHRSINEDDDLNEEETKGEEEEET